MSHRSGNSIFSAAGPGGRSLRLVAILAFLFLPFVQGCAQGELELLVNDIKKFYLKGGLSFSSAEKGDPASVGEFDEKGVTAEDLLIEQAYRIASPSGEVPSSDAARGSGSQCPVSETDEGVGEAGE